MAVVVFAVGEVSETETRGLLLIVGPNQALSIAVEAAQAVPRGVFASSGLHATASLKARDHICAGSIKVASVRSQSLSVRISARKVQQVHSGEGDQEAAEQ